MIFCFCYKMKVKTSVCLSDCICFSYFCLNIFILGLAIRTYTLDDVVETNGGVALGQRDLWNLDFLKTVCLLADCAVEMSVHVVVMLFVVVCVADFVFYRSATVFNFVDKVMCAEKRQATRDGAFVYRLQYVFYVGHRKRVFCFLQRAEY